MTKQAEYKCKDFLIISILRSQTIITMEVAHSLIIIKTNRNCEQGVYVIVKSKLALFVVGFSFNFLTSMRFSQEVLF